MTSLQTLDDRFSAQEHRFLIGIGLVLALRQLVLLLALPFIALFGSGLEGGTPALVGLSLGIYGLLQALLQVPFGRASDAFGRKRMILAGTAFLVLGLYLAAVATDIATFIVGRALQGCGAVTAVAYAWIADSTPPEKRNRAMGIGSAASGGAAIASFVAGPLLYGVLSLPQIFFICAGLAGVTMIYVAITMDESPGRTPSAPSPAGRPDLRPDGPFVRLIVSGFLLNFVLMAVCFIAPLLIDRELGARELWKIFIPATLLGIAAMLGGTRLADAGHFKSVSSISFAAFAGTALCLLQGGVAALLLGTTLFMSGYLILAALLPAAVSGLADASFRASATGGFYTAMFLGAFAGGTATGALWGIDPRAPAMLMIAASLAGLALVAMLPSPALLSADRGKTC